MLEGGRYCIDVLNQIQAAKAALNKIEERILKDHADTCVSEAIDSGNARENSPTALLPRVALLAVESRAIARKTTTNSRQRGAG